jgi:aspartate kinase
MAIVVQKFGGTSVATADLVRRAAGRAIRATQGGHNVVVVVSARGQTTDELLNLAYEITDRPNPRELDQLVSTGEQISIALVAMAIHAAGHGAISFTGGQVGLVTDAVHTKARIQHVNAQRIHDEFAKGNIVIIAGFQGVDVNQNVTTLGRGGSDTTAVALAAALKADVCEIYTDVDGVFTADPRLVPTARKLDEITYDEMLELASLGAGVLRKKISHTHPRPVQPDGKPGHDDRRGGEPNGNHYRPRGGPGPGPGEGDDPGRSRPAGRGGADFPRHRRRQRRRR